MNQAHHFFSKTFRSAAAVGIVCAAAMALPAAAKDTPAQWQALIAQSKITLVQAIGKATSAVPGKAIEAQLDDGKGVARYEVEIITPQAEKVEVWVNAVTGEAVMHENDGPAKRKDKERLAASRIHLAQAVEAALAHTPGTALEAELDSDWGVPTYSVDVLTAQGIIMDVKVNPTDGSVIRAKRD